MASDQELRRVVERINLLLGEFGESREPAIRRDAKELVRLLMQLYGAGLTRIVRLLEMEDRHSGRLLDALLLDDLVASLLVLHDLHPDNAETRIRRALNLMEQSTGTRVTLLAVDSPGVVVTVDAPPPSSLIDLRRLIDDVVRAAAPDIAHVDIQGLPPAPVPPLVQLTRRAALSDSNELSTP
jgi:hypothetical protein